MPQYKLSSKTAKAGLNFVRSVVEESNCIFHKIEQENDLGIDGLVELIRNESPLNTQVAVQIKAGESYFVQKTQACLIPIGDHRKYWSNYPLPVFGLVYVPSLYTAYWVNIKNYLKNHPGEKTIRFNRTEVNLFDKKGFTSLFMPMVLKEIPNISFTKAMRLFKSERPDEFELGLVVLFRNFPNRRRVWDEFVSFFRKTPAEQIPSSLVYYFAHVPWHGDIMSIGEHLTSDTRKFIQTKHFQDFGTKDVVKLLSLVDEENLISRGTIGQSVEAIISSLAKCDSILEAILKNNKHPKFVREVAVLIYAMHKPIDAIKYLKELEKGSSWYAGELINHLGKWKYFNPYE